MTFEPQIARHLWHVLAECCQQVSSLWVTCNGAPTHMPLNFPRSAKEVYLSLVLQVIGIAFAICPDLHPPANSSAWQSAPCTLIHQGQFQCMVSGHLLHACVAAIFFPNAFTSAVCMIWTILFVGIWVSCSFEAIGVDMSHYNSFVNASEPSMRDFQLVANCLHRSNDSGLVMGGPMCWDGRHMTVRCTGYGHYGMDDFMNVIVRLVPATTFDHRLRQADVEWRNGTSFLMGSHIWPHNIQHTWPALNVPALGFDLKHIGMFGMIGIFKNRFGRFDSRLGILNRYNIDLVNALAQYYGLTIMPPNFNLRDHFKFWRRGEYQRGKMLCFEHVVVPNKGPSPKVHKQTPAFLSPGVMIQRRQPFLEHYYDQVRSKSTDPASLPPSFPRRPPWRVLVVNRSEQHGRRLLNEDELVAMIRSFDVPVTVADFAGKNLAQQFLEVAQAGVFLAPHGAGFVNALMLPPGSVAIEVYPIAERYGAGEWTRYLQLSGVKSIEYCWNNGYRCLLCQGSKPYPYNNSEVDVERLRPLVKAALDMVRGFNDSRWFVLQNTSDPLPDPPKRPRIRYVRRRANITQRQ